MQTHVREPPTAVCKPDPAVCGDLTPTNSRNLKTKGVKPC
jgi:hypothetical protein